MKSKALIRKLQLLSSIKRKVSYIESVREFSQVKSYEVGTELTKILPDETIITLESSLNLVSEQRK